MRSTPKVVHSEKVSRQAQGVIQLSDLLACRTVAESACLENTYDQFIVFSIM